jgi:hypothetical protein
MAGSRHTCTATSKAAGRPGESANSPSHESHRRVRSARTFDGGGMTPRPRPQPGFSPPGCGLLGEPQCCDANPFGSIVSRYRGSHRGSRSGNSHAQCALCMRGARRRPSPDLCRTSPRTAAPFRVVTPPIGAAASGFQPGGLATSPTRAFNGRPGERNAKGNQARTPVRHQRRAGGPGRACRRACLRTDPSSS